VKKYIIMGIMVYILMGCHNTSNSEVDLVGNIIEDSDSVKINLSQEIDLPMPTNLDTNVDTESIELVDQDSESATYTMEDSIEIGYKVGDGIVDNFEYFTFAEGEEVDITDFLIEGSECVFPEGYLKDTYWTGDAILDRALLANIIESEYTRAIFEDSIVQAYLTKEAILDLNQMIEWNNYQEEEREISFRKGAVYDKYMVQPFYTVYDDYIGVLSVIRYKGFTDLSDDEAFALYSIYPSQYRVDYDYYHINSSGDYQWDDRGYYKKLYSNNIPVEMIGDQLLDVSQFIDYSYDDYFSREYNRGNVVGYTKWTGNSELDHALFAYILYENSFDTRFREEYIVENINKQEADDIIYIYRNSSSPEFYMPPFSEITIEPYNLENVFLINMAVITYDSSIVESYDELFEECFVVKQQDGKYMFYYSEEDLYQDYNNGVFN
jgi:hypothetical protein